MFLIANSAFQEYVPILNFFTLCLQKITHYVDMAEKQYKMLSGHVRRALRNEKEIKEIVEEVTRGPRIT